MSQFIDYTSGNRFKKLILAMTPLVCLNFLMLIYNLVDYYWLGYIDLFHQQPVSQTIISCIGGLSMLFWLGQGIVGFIRPGLEYYSSRQYGEDKDVNHCSIWFSSAIVLGVIFIIGFCLLIYFFEPQILQFLSLQASSNYAHNYLLFYLPALGLLLFNLILSSILLVSGKTFPIFLINGVGILFNLFLDPYLILEKHFEEYGAGLSTLISAFVTTLILIIFIYRYHLIIQFKTKFSAMRAIVQKSFPIGVSSCVFTFVSMIITSTIISHFGDVANATKTIGANIESISWNVFGLAIGQVVGVYVAQNVGYHSHDFFKPLTKLIIIISVIALIVSACMLFIPQLLFSIFTTNHVIIAAGKDYLQILSFSQIFMCFEAIFVGMINGFGKTQYNYIISLMFNIILIIIINIIPNNVDLLWLVLGIVNCLRGCCALGCYLHLKRLYQQGENYE